MSVDPLTYSGIYLDTLSRTNTQSLRGYKPSEAARTDQATGATSLSGENVSNGLGGVQSSDVANAFEAFEALHSIRTRKVGF